MKTILLIICAVLFFSFSMKKAVPIQVNCVELNEIIRCASLDKILGTDGTLSDKVLNRNIYHLYFQAVRNDLVDEIVTSESNNKVYHLEAIHRINSPSKAIVISNTVLKQLKVCLDAWELDSTVQQPAGSQKIKDYLFTNSEDETTVRLSVSKQLPKCYTVALEIY